MSIKVLMVDVDGVIVRHPRGLRWDRDLQADLGVDPNDLQAHFFARYWPDLLRGRGKIETRLAEALPAFAPHVSAAALMGYWFAQDAHRDEVLLADLAALRATGVKLHLATDQEHARAAYLWNDLGFKIAFDAMHYAADLGGTKRESAFLEAATTRAGVKEDEIGFIDDLAGNILAAQNFGWRGYVWTPQSTLAEALAVIRA